ncbi:MAG: glucose-1-phosphate adenylyltransferase [Planctomycetes bacterium]|nr:glucose-1-phosphate adenylyltransferase [Planctomycetota bacterium]
MDIHELLKQTLVMVLAGGQGERLYPLTRDRAKPAVPFGGSYRLIDFSLSNCVNSGLRRIYVLTQHKSDSLNRHIRSGWQIFAPSLGEYIETRPPQRRLSTNWYLGTADAIYQNIFSLQHERPRYVLILSGDHVYHMDYSRMISLHHDRDADLTVACIERPVDDARGKLGVLTPDGQERAVRFDEKPEAPEPLPGRSGACLCSMGVYLFRTETLVRRVTEDAKSSGGHDFARDVLPVMIEKGDNVSCHRYEGTYWRDIGAIDAYWHAHQDLVSVEPAFNLYDPEWRIRVRCQSRPPAKIVFGGGDAQTPRAEVYNSLICSGAIVSGAFVCDSVIGPDVRIEVGSRIEQSIILSETTVGRNAIIRRAIVDKRNHIPDNARVGVDTEWDRRHFSISDEGVVAIPKEVPFPEF